MVWCVQCGGMVYCGLCSVNEYGVGWCGVLCLAWCCMLSRVICSDGYFRYLWGVVAGH